MTNNLEYKIRLLVKDLEDLGTSDRVRIIQKFIEKEMGLVEAEHVLSVYDLNLIRARAIAIGMEQPTNRTLEGEPIYADPENFRVLCFAEAAFEFLRGKGYLKHQFAFEEKKRRVPVCAHSRAEQDPDSTIVSYVCPDCKAKVAPVMWRKLG